MAVQQGPGTMPTGASPGAAASQKGAAAPSGGAGQHAGAGANGGNGAGHGGGGAQYHVVQQTVTTGVTDNGNTAVKGIQPGNVVANSSFDKLVSGAPVTLSKQGLPVSQTSISGESSAP